MGTKQTKGAVLIFDMEVLNKWVAEFYIRRQKNPRLSPASLLSALKFGDSGDYFSNLKTASLLRDISDSLFRGDDLGEETLDQLEALEKLQGGSVVVTETHKCAYCWTAAECTVRSMWPLSASEGLFEDALERVWRKRVGSLKESGSGLVSGELLKWEEDLEKALVDPEMYQRIRESNVRYSAVCFLTQLLEEQWGLLGSSSLESVAQRLLGKRKAVDVHHVEEEEEEERRMGSREQEDEQSLDREVARELKDYLLEIQRQISDPSTTRQVQEEPITPQRSRVNRTGTSGSGQEEDNNASSSRVRPHLPTPVPLNVSPLKKGGVRRQKKFWTPEEEKVLIEGVKEHGKSWKAIKNANPAVFRDRTEVDLKDKWRNLTEKR